MQWIIAVNYMMNAMIVTVASDIVMNCFSNASDLTCMHPIRWREMQDYSIGYLNYVIDSFNNEAHVVLKTAGATFLYKSHIFEDL